MTYGQPGYRQYLPVRPILDFAVVVVILAAGAWVVLSRLNPYTTRILPECIFSSSLGWLCPGCGGTRAAYSLFHGDFVASVEMNPIPASGILALTLLCVASTPATLRRPLTSIRLTHAALIIILVAFSYAVILRNLPWL